MPDLPPQSIVLREALRAARRAGVSAQAQGLLGFIIAEAWPSSGTYVAKLGFPVIEAQFGCTRHTLRRWADELERAELVRRRNGHAHQISRWTITLHHDQEGAPMHRGGCASAPSKGAPAHPVSEQTDLSAAASAEPNPAAAAEIDVHQAKKNWRLLSRPEWCSSSPWLDDRTRRAIATSTDEIIIRWAMIETKRGRSNLENPAGFLRSLIRNPDTWAVDQLRERMTKQASPAT